MAGWIRGFFVAISALAVATLTMASAADAIERESTPLLHHPAREAAGAEGVITELTQDIVHQTLTTTRAVVLDAAVARVNASGRALDGFDAGHRLFGVYDGPAAWAFCGTRPGLFARQLTCYSDTDRDGRFDVAQASGAPFMGVPFLIFGSGERRALPTPAPYRTIAPLEGPSQFAVIRVALREVRTGSRARTGSVTLTFGYRAGEHGFSPVGRNSKTLDITGAGPVRVRIRGAVIEFSGAARRGELHYRIITPPPPTLETVTMSQTVVSVPTYTYIPIYVPR